MIGEAMLGAVIGDIVGSPFEFDPYKNTDFELFRSDADFTDDTVLHGRSGRWVNRGCQDNLAVILQNWCRRYPNPKGAYGARFREWIFSENPQPYGSWGNGSAMRVSAVGWAFDNLDDVLHYAGQSAAVTHNHPEGIKGAQAVAAAVYWARKGRDKAFIRRQIADRFGYDLNRNCDDIRPNYRFDESCMGRYRKPDCVFR